MHPNSISPGRRFAAAALACVAAFGACAAVALGAAGARVAAARTPACAAAGLVIWLGQGNGAAGSVYYKIEFTNESGRACTLTGYPGVSAINIGYRQLGSAAAREDSVRPRTVTVANNATATAVLRIVSVGVLPASRCRPVNAAGLRVFPPNRRAAKIIPFPFAACSRAGASYLTVRAVQPG
jgi:hypothetical protein